MDDPGLVTPASRRAHGARSDPAARLRLSIGVLMSFVALAGGSSGTVGAADVRSVNDTGGTCLVRPGEPPVAGTSFDSFDGDGPLVDYTTSNAAALPAVGRKNGRYHAALTDNTGNVTLHFNQSQGRLDAKRVVFPFEFVVRNVGIGSMNDSQRAPSPTSYPNPSRLYIFAGIQVHALDLERRDSAHLVVGHRGSTSYTVEGKNTVNGQSSVNDNGQGIVPAGRADLRVVGDANGVLTWFWQEPNANPGVTQDDWVAYRGSGLFPGSQASFGEAVYVGLITYAYGSQGVPFVGTADSIEWMDGSR